MNVYYNKHYIMTDSNGLVIDRWSDGPNPEKDTTNAICINEEGGYQFRFTSNGEENPPLYNLDGIPLYKWDGTQVIPRTDEEIAADRLPSLEDAKSKKLKELSITCNKAITEGCDVTLSDGTTGHISLTTEDQINLSNAVQAINQGATEYPYHLDGQLFVMYSAADIMIMNKTANDYKLYHTTYYNHLAALVRRCESIDEVLGISYGDALPDDLTENMSIMLGDNG